MSVQPEKKKKKQKEEAEKKPLWQEVLSFIGTLAAAMVLLSLVCNFLIQPVRVSGTSMTNTLLDGEITLVSKLDKDLSRNDVVICNYPNRVDDHWSLGTLMLLDQHTLFVKRLVALPGDTVAITDGKLYVNGQVVPDPENMGSVPRNYPLRTLGDNEYFVIGDNRLTSHDSRAEDVGPISRDMIKGKVKWVMWPLNRIRGVE